MKKVFITTAMALAILGGSALTAHAANLCCQVQAACCASGGACCQ